MAMAYSGEPKQLHIKPRRIELKFDEDTPRYWFAGDPFLTHFLNALSITFPPGERMFMDAVRAVRDQVDDPVLQKQISGFLAQEALHSRAHVGLNTHLKKWGYPVDELEGEVRRLLDTHKRLGSKRDYLSTTCALEHVTAMLGHRLLTRPSLQAQFHESLRPMWMWHAVEETEHKAVAYDVYQRVFGRSYFARVRGMLRGTLGLFVMVPYMQARLLAHDGLALHPRRWLRGIFQLWGPGGLLAGLTPIWLDYFRPNFHPWQHDNSELLTDWQPA